MKHYRFQFMHHCSQQDINVCFEFCLDDQHMMEQAGFVEKLNLSDESRFHVCGKVKTLNAYNWGASNPKEVLRRSVSKKMRHNLPTY